MANKIKTRFWNKVDDKDGWEVDFTVKLPDGKRPHRVRVQSPRKTRAQSIAWAEELKINLLKAGVRPPSRAEKKRQAKTQAKLPTSCPTLKAFVPRWVSGYLQAEDFSPNTIALRESQIELYLLPLFGDTPLDQLGAESFARLKGSLQKKVRTPGERSARSRNQIVGVLYQIIEAAYQWGVITHLPPRPKRVKEPINEVEIYTEDEALRLIAAAPKVSWQANLVVLLGIEAGLRLSEMIGLRWSDIDLVAKRMVIRQQEDKAGIRKPKGKKTRPLGIRPRLLEALKTSQHLINDRVLAIEGERKGGERVGPYEVQSWLHAVEKRAKLTKARSPHKLRHTFASWCLKEGLNIKELQVLLGHSSMQTTLGYVHLQPEQSERVLAWLSGGERVESKGQ
jgi:integrase